MFRDAVRKVVTDSEGFAVTVVAEQTLESGGVIPVVCCFIPTRHCYSHNFSGIMQTNTEDNGLQSS